MICWFEGCWGNRSTFCEAQLPQEMLREFLPRLISVSSPWVSFRNAITKSGDIGSIFQDCGYYTLEEVTAIFSNTKRMLPLLSQVLLSNMVYAEDDEALLEAEVKFVTSSNITSGKFDNLNNSPNREHIPHDVHPGL